MALVKYTYSIQTNITAQEVASDKLRDEINVNQSIPITCDYIDTDGDVLDIYMQASLSTEQKTELDSVVLSHDGIAYPSKASDINYTFADDKSGQFSNLFISDLHTYGYTKKTGWDDIPNYLYEAETTNFSGEKPLFKPAVWDGIAGNCRITRWVFSFPIQIYTEGGNLNVITNFSDVNNGIDLLFVGKYDSNKTLIGHKMKGLNVINGEFNFLWRNRETIIETNKFLVVDYVSRCTQQAEISLKFTIKV